MMMQATGWGLRTLRWVVGNTATTTRGKKHLAGTVAQVSAGEVEEFIIRLLREELGSPFSQEAMNIEERKHLQSILPEKLAGLPVDKILVKSLIKKRFYPKTI